MIRGDVVLVDWPYSDRTGSKLRPTFVLHSLQMLILNRIKQRLVKSTQVNGVSLVEPSPSQNHQTHHSARFPQL